MKRSIFALAAISLLSFVTSANADVIWSFGGSPEQVAQGTAFTTVDGTITVYAEQLKSNGSLATVPDSTENGLFRVNNSVNPDGIGIAPYNPTEGTGSSFANQDGISESNIIELKLGSNIAQGTTLSFLLQSGVFADNADTVSVFYKDSTVALKPGSMNVLDNSVNDPIGGISTNGTVSQFSITKDTAGTEYVAIEADCHYLLLTQASVVTTIPLPEPGTNALLMFGFLGLAGIYLRKRQVTAQS